MDVRVKEEALEIRNVSLEQRRQRNNFVSNVPPHPDSVIELSSSDSESDSESDADLDTVVASAVQSAGSPFKKRKVNEKGGFLPIGFLSPLPPQQPSSSDAVLYLPAPEWASNTTPNRFNKSVNFTLQGCKQFWKAGDYDGPPARAFETSTGDFFYFYYFFPFRLCFFFNY